MDSSQTIFRYLQSVGAGLDAAFMRHALGTLVEGLMAVEVSRFIEADYYERKQGRLAYRNGYRGTIWRTAYGDVVLRIPKLRRGTYYPAFLNTLAEEALVNLVEEAYLFGVRAERVEQLLARLNFEHVRRQQVTDLAGQLETLVAAHRFSAYSSEHVYVWLDAVEFEILPSSKVPDVMAVAVGGTALGEHEFIGFEFGFDADDAALWEQLLRQLTARGLSGVELVVSGAYRGLKAALSDWLPHVRWQYSRRHLLNELLKGAAPDDPSEVVAAIASMIVQNHTLAEHHPLERAVRSLRANSPEASMLLAQTGTDWFTSMSLPQVDWNLFVDTVTLERVKQALNSSQDAVGLLLDQAVLSPAVIAQASEADMRMPVPAGELALAPVYELSGMLRENER